MRPPVYRHPKFSGGGISLRPQKELYRQLSFIAYYFHWDLERTLALPHLEREKFCREISQINKEANTQEKNLFDL